MFYSFLNELCIKNSSFEVYILAWDFSAYYSYWRGVAPGIDHKLEYQREIHFRFDNSHAVGASHHQKFVVIDGVFAFAGGMDVCSL